MCKRAGKPHEKKLKTRVKNQATGISHAPPPYKVTNKKRRDCLPFNCPLMGPWGREQTCEKTIYKNPANKYWYRHPEAQGLWCIHKKQEKEKNSCKNCTCSDKQQQGKQPRSRTTTGPRLLDQLRRNGLLHQITSLTNLESSEQLLVAKTTS